MAKVRKRTWRTSRGETKSAWVADFRDASGARTIETFSTKKAADAFLIDTGHQIAEGVHTPIRSSINVREAAELWLTSARLNKLERATLQQYEQHAKFHILPLLGPTKLAALTTPTIQRFADKLLTREKADGSGEMMSRSLARKILSSLKSILREAQRQGKVAKNPALPVSIRVSKRGSQKLRAGRDFPDKAEINTIFKAASGRWRPLIVVAIFTGLRSSELRGLRWADVDLNGGKIHVHQRADQWGTMGAPKSEAGERVIPIAPPVIAALKEWKLACPRKDGKLGLVFPNGEGNVESHGNIVNRGWNPLQIAAGLTEDTGEKDADGKPILRPRYSFHGLRHFFASWLLDQGFSLKRAQAMLGHATMAMTADTYGHLLPDLENDAAKMAAGALALVQ
jgi:integrase